MALIGCTPALNWRHVNVSSAGVTVMMPCKPDQATRAITLRVADKSETTHLQLQGCEAAGMQFTFGVMAVPPGLPAEEAIQAWRLASLASLNADASATVPLPWEIQGSVKAQTLATRVRLMMPAHQVQWAWFANGNTIYQAAVYGKAKEKELPEAAETYFSGIKLP